MTNVTIAIPKVIEITPGNPISTSSSTYSAYCLTVCIPDPHNSMESSTLTLHKRYSELLKYHQSVLPWLPKLDSPAPAFPGKTMGRLTESQKEKRRENLEAYFCFLVNIYNARVAADAPASQAGVSSLVSSVSGRSTTATATASTAALSASPLVAVSDSVADFLTLSEHMSPTLPATAMNDPHKYTQERQNKLMEACSFVADGLVRIYFLDCTFRTVKYTQETTLGQVSSKLSPFLDVAIVSAGALKRRPASVPLR
ncbi:hypothetical protein TeGR_g678, partial [Tetraparma gracilis]